MVIFGLVTFFRTFLSIKLPVKKRQGTKSGCSEKEIRWCRGLFIIAFLLRAKWAGRTTMRVPAWNTVTVSARPSGFGQTASIDIVFAYFAYYAYYFAYFAYWRQYTAIWAEATYCWHILHIFLHIILHILHIKYNKHILHMMHIILHILHIVLHIVLHILHIELNCIFCI